jgi:hypothetical protein
MLHWWPILSWFRNKSRRPPQELTKHIIRFVGEQDGASERDLKSSLVEVFLREPTVRRAYLARTDYRDTTGVHVALCVKSSVGVCHELKSKVFDIFSSMFGSHEHLDVLFIRDDQEQELGQVCRPFYRAE